MAAINLNQLFGGQFTTSGGTGSGSATSGSSGAIASISSPTGGRVRLDFLTSRTDTVTGISIEVDGVAIISNATLIAANGSGGFIVSSSIENTRTRQVLSDVIGSLIEIKAQSPTAQAIDYQWSEE